LTRWRRWTFALTLVLFELLAVGTTGIGNSLCKKVRGKQPPPLDYNLPS
jgi:hypothetical protein